MIITNEEWYCFKPRLTSACIYWILQQKKKEKRKKEKGKKKKEKSNKHRTNEVANIGCGSEA